MIEIKIINKENQKHLKKGDIIDFIMHKEQYKATLIYQGIDNHGYIFIHKDEGLRVGIGLSKVIAMICETHFKSIEQ